eukprot:7005350-Alexandrium_andersonii.AAC.1
MMGVGRWGAPCAARLRGQREQPCGTTSCRSPWREWKPGAVCATRELRMPTSNPGWTASAAKPCGAGREFPII